MPRPRQPSLIVSSCLADSLVRCRPQKKKKIRLCSPAQHQTARENPSFKNSEVELLLSIVHHSSSAPISILHVLGHRYSDSLGSRIVMALPPPLSIADILHIVETIADHISLGDLYHCVLVSHAWHHTLITCLWRNVVTFRPVSLPPIHRDIKTHYEYRFRSPESRTALTKYTHHVRFLTCGNELFHVHYDCILYRLVEIHYVAKVFPTSAFFSSQWTHATRHLDVGNVWACPHLFKFTEFLKKFPSITWMGICWTWTPNTTGRTVRPWMFCRRY